MSELEESFTKLLGKTPTDTQRQQLYRVRDALGLKNNDALWLVLMSLEYYQDQYEKFPEAIAKAAQQTLNTIKSTADATMKASAEAAKADLAQTISTLAHQVAHRTSTKQMWQWTAVAVAVICIIMGVFGWGMHHIGYEHGYSDGYSKGYHYAKAEKATIKDPVRQKKK